ncbi:MAG: tripartite tricarboxylate transporter TctB family protein [Planctomycetota bacterium]|jgi:hypothetical protein|nr:tripartite tricarboxylate transporter TctB family protein [Planctomycetota bacterium]
MFAYEFIASLLVIAGGAAIVIASGRLGDFNSYSSSFGPGYWPSFLGWAMLALGVVLLLEALVKLAADCRRAAAGLAVEKLPPPIDFASPGFYRVYWLILILGGFMLALRLAGFLAGTVFLTPACMILLRERRPLILAAMTAGVPVAVYLIFVRLIGVHLP